MTTTLRNRILLSVVVGVLVGLGAAIAIPRTQAGPGSGPHTTPAPRMAPAHRSSHWADQSRLRPIAGTVRLVARLADPDGGPEWVVRSFAATETSPPNPEHPSYHHRGHPRVCAQLGRLVRGRFGWIDGANTFRPVGFEYEGAPVACRDPGTPVGDAGLPAVVSTLSGQTSPSPRLTRTVVWGMAGDEATDLRVSVGGRPRGVAADPSGAYLALLPTGTARAQIAVTAAGPGSRRVDLMVAPRRANTAWTQPKWLLASLGEPATVVPVVTARAPDPNGGAPWALAAVPDTKGGWCVSDPGRLIDGRVGNIDLFDQAPGTFTEAHIGAGNCRRGRLAPNAKSPISLGGELGGSSGGHFAGARAARRTMAGYTILWGRVASDVTSLTVRSARDVRTLVPGMPARAFLLVYDGPFVTGGPTVTATTASGRTVHEGFGSTPGPGG
jgi:hypothetical protein